MVGQSLADDGLAQRRQLIVVETRKVFADRRIDVRVEELFAVAGGQFASKAVSMRRALSVGLLVDSAAVLIEDFLAFSRADPFPTQPCLLEQYGPRVSIVVVGIEAGPNLTLFDLRDIATSLSRLVAATESQSGADSSFIGLTPISLTDGRAPAVKPRRREQVQPGLGIRH